MESKPVLEQSARLVDRFEPGAVECSKDTFAPIVFLILVFRVAHLLLPMEQCLVLILRVWGAARPSPSPLISPGRLQRPLLRMAVSSVVILAFAVRLLKFLALRKRLSNASRLQVF